MMKYLLLFCLGEINGKSLSELLWIYDSIYFHNCCQCKYWMYKIQVLEKEMRLWRVEDRAAQADWAFEERNIGIFIKWLYDIAKMNNSRIKGVFVHTE